MTKHTNQKELIDNKQNTNIFITRYIDTFKMNITFFGFLLISTWMILGIPSQNQNILFYIGNGLLFYLIYAIWNRFDNRKVFSSVKVPKEIVKPLQRLSKVFINGLIIITTVYWIVNQLLLNKSLFNLNEIPNWVVIILLILFGFKFIVKLLEAKLITHYIKIQAKLNMDDVMQNDYMTKMKKEMQNKKMPKYQPKSKKTPKKQKRKKN